MDPSKDAQEIYDKKAGLYHKFFFSFFRYDRAVESFLQKEQYLQRNYKVLDAGCGSGLVTKSLCGISVKKRITGIRFYAFDISGAMLIIFRKWIKGNTIKNIRLKRADVLNIKKLPKRWKDYDMVISSAMLEHIPKKSIQQAIGNLRKLLRRNGRLILFITKKSFITHWLVKRWWNAETYSLEEIEKILSMAGFRSIRLKQFPPPFSYFNKGMLIIDAKKK